LLRHNVHMIDQNAKRTNARRRTTPNANWNSSYRRLRLEMQVPYASDVFNDGTILHLFAPTSAANL
jgi:hypothetical protein